MFIKINNHKCQCRNLRCNQIIQPDELVIGEKIFHPYFRGNCIKNYHAFCFFQLNKDFNENLEGYEKLSNKKKNDLLKLGYENNKNKDIKNKENKGKDENKEENKDKKKSAKEYEKLSVVNLRELLKKEGKTTVGKKSELIQRLMTN